MRDRLLALQSTEDKDAFRLRVPDLPGDSTLAQLTVIVSRPTTLPDVLEVSGVPEVQLLSVRGTLLYPDVEVTESGVRLTYFVESGLSYFVEVTPDEESYVSGPYTIEATLD